MALATVAVLLALPAMAQDVTLDGEPVDLGVYGAPLRFEAPEGVVMELESGRRLVDTVEFRPNPQGGTIVIAEMDLDTYVAGLAEMPGHGPMEALKGRGRTDLRVVRGPARGPSGPALRHLCDHGLPGLRGPCRRRDPGDR